MSNKNINMNNKCGSCRTEFAEELNKQKGKQIKETKLQENQDASEHFEGLKDR